MKRMSLQKFAWLSIGAAVLTIGLKTLAYFLTGSVGLLSDALESFVNLAAAVIALLMIRLSEKPPDEDHVYGHTKAEYFASIAEGAFIMLAAISISYTAIDRIIHPKIIQAAFLGIGVSVVASLINLIVALYLLSAGKKFRSITLEADGRHLMTDVWTSVAVITGVFIVAATHIQILDPLIAIAVAINIIITGVKLLKESAMGLMDSSIPKDEIQIITTILDTYCINQIRYHGLRTRLSATRRFISFHVLVPGKWSVQRGHNLLEEIEKEIREKLPKTTIFTHLEPVEDPVSQEDVSIERE